MSGRQPQGDEGRQSSQEASKTWRGRFATRRCWQLRWRRARCCCETPAVRPAESLQLVLLCSECAKTFASATCISRMLRKHCRRARCCLHWRRARCCCETPAVRPAEFLQLVLLCSECAKSFASATCISRMFEKALPQSTLLLRDARSAPCQVFQCFAWCLVYCCGGETDRRAH